MSSAEKLSGLGWNLSPEGLKQVSENGTITDVKILIRNALDLDIREISNGGFPEDINKGKLESIPGKFVVQVLKIRNVSAPKANEESRAAPRMLKLSLTDGVSVCHALEVVNIQSMSLNTPPGTKLFLKGKTLPMVHGIILLSPPLVDVLGGKVPALIEKWELSRSLAKHKRGQSGEGGPPPWVAFGQKIQRTNPLDRNFKSLSDGKDKETQDHGEFEAQRKDAIAEAAAKGGGKKVFGGGNKPLLDHNVQQLVDYGFAEYQAVNALRITRNNVERALRNLQRGEEGGTAPRDRDHRSDEPREERRERRRKGDRGDREDDGPRPSTTVSLFAFLEDKLPPQDEKETPSRSYGSNSYGSDNRFSDSTKSGNYRGGRQERGNASSQGRGGRGAQNRGRGRGNTSSWSDRDTKDRSGNSNTRLERSDRNNYRQNNFERQSQVPQMHQQKPPRFQNQQYYHPKENTMHQQQQQQQQQQPQPPQQNWPTPMLSINETNFSTSNWSAHNPTTNFHENEFQNARDSFSTQFYDSRNSSSRPYTQPNFGIERSYGRSDDRSTANARGFDRQQEDLTRKLEAQHLSRGGFNSQRKPPKPMQPQNTMYQVNFGFKDTRPIRGGMTISHDSFVIGGLNRTNQYSQDNKSWMWHKGDKCMAKYWEDKKYHNAEVTGVSQRTCVVRFLEYGNYEEVLQDDCIPLTDDS